MSDLTLTERLRKHAASGIAPLYRRTATEAAARITELEAMLRRSGQGLAEVVNDKTRLEAERDRLKAALEEIAKAREEEREACAKIAEHAGFVEAPMEGELWVANRIAAAIRVRSTPPAEEKTP
jgi:hypothetical protein